jgi:hypothetical protein
LPNARTNPRQKLTANFVVFQQQRRQLEQAAHWIERACDFSTPRQHSDHPTRAHAQTTQRSQQTKKDSLLKYKTPFSVWLRTCTHVPDNTKYTDVNEHIPIRAFLAKYKSVNPVKLRTGSRAPAIVQCRTNK